MLLTRPHIQPRLNEKWQQTVAEYFTPGRTTPLPAPLSSFFISKNQKILYSPIAKCACTSLTRVLVELSDIPNSNIILEQGVHRVTDAFVTGVQLEDYDLDTVREVLASDEYYKFAVVREPVSRIISAYTEKFLLNRLDNRNHVHTLDVVRTVRNESDPDLTSGISFRQFIEYLLSSDPAGLDPHWAPQAMFLAGVDRYDDVFTMEQLPELADQLSALTGQEIELGRHNTSLDSEAGSADAVYGRYVDALPVELDAVSGITATDFMAPDLVEELQQFYDEDVAIYQSSLKGDRTYEPVLVSLEKVREEFPQQQTLARAPEIARSLNLYSKGFFALDNDGRGQVSVMISNTRSYTLDFTALEPCSLVYILRSDSGEIVHKPQIQMLEIDYLEPGAVISRTLHIAVPEQFRKTLSNVVISLQFGDSFRVEDVAPLHVATAQVAIASRQ
ncbi:MAG: sulfotransferase family protein [Halioglobus sp.]